MATPYRSPAPWAVDEGVEYSGQAVVRSASGAVVAEAMDPLDLPVMSAAPEMYEVLKEYQRMANHWLKTGEPCSPGMAYTLAKRTNEVLTKAERDLFPGEPKE